MTHLSSYSEREKLEFIFHNSKPKSPRESNLVTRVKKISKTIITWLIHGNEMQVWHSQDQAGNIVWNAYDPVKNVTIRGAKESELRAWLEERYYK